MHTNDTAPSVSGDCGIHSDLHVSSNPRAQIYVGSYDSRFAPDMLSNDGPIITHQS